MIYLHIQIHTYTYIHIHIYTQTHIYTHTHTFMHTYSHTCMYIVCRYICICIIFVFSHVFLNLSKEM